MAKFKPGDTVIAKKDDNSLGKSFVKGDTLRILEYDDHCDYQIKNLTRPERTEVLRGYAFQSELMLARKSSLKDEKWCVSKYYFLGIPIAKKRSNRCDCE